MKIAMDSQGRKVHYKDGFKNKKYFCPYCTEGLILKKGCFAHKIIKDRTPLQRTCPEYHENESYRKIDDAVDVIYIKNGGIPLYLCNDGNKLELRAYFPTISEECKSKLIEDQTIVMIDNKKWCSVENLNYYTVYDIKKWIDISVDPKTECNEIKRKWLWGIKGIDTKNDIYNANNEGGYRVAINGNICVGKKYRMMFSEKIPYVCGIAFKNIGRIKLKEYGKQKIFVIYEMEIIKFTEEARQFIEGKGYRLVETLIKVTPLWPPAISKGNELTFDYDTAWFYYSTMGDHEYFYEIQEDRICKLYGSKIFKISNISICREKAIVITNKLVHDQKIVGTSAEIKYILNYKKKLNDKNPLKPKIIIKDIEGQLIDYKQNNLPIPKDGKLFIDTNIPILARLIKDSYCIYSSKYYLEEIACGKAINIGCNGFGNIYYKYNKIVRDSKKINKIDWKILYIQLCKCRGKTVGPTYRNKILLYKVKKNINRENRNVYEMIYKWIKKRKVPIDAQRLLDEVEGEI